MTKKQKALLELYKRATKETLYECYACPSMLKRYAYQDIAMKCHLLHGWRIRIPSYNTFQFSMAFLYQQGGKTMLHYETARNVWDFEVLADQL